MYIIGSCQSRVQAPLKRLSPWLATAYDKRVVKQKKQQYAAFFAAIDKGNLTVLEKSCGHCKVWVIYVAAYVWRMKYCDPRQ